MRERLPAGIWPVLLAVLLDLIGFGLVIPLLTFYAEDHGATPFQVTALMAIYSLAQLVMAPVWGLLSDRVGRRPVMLVSIGGSAVMLAGFAMSTELWQLFLFRALHGACAANIAAAQAYVADVTTPQTRARGMGLIGASFGLGFTLGPWLGGELAVFGLSVPIWVAAALSAGNFAWAWLRLPESLWREGRRGGERRVDPRALLPILRDPVIGMAVGLTFVATFAFAMMESTFALVAEHVWGMEAWHVGRLFAWIGVVGIVVQGGLIGRLVRRFGERVLLGVGYATNAAGLGLLAVVGSSAGIVAGCTLIALGTSLANPSLTSLISRAAPEERQGVVLGANQSFSALARATAPVLGGALYAGWYPQAALATGAVLMSVALLLSLPAGRRATQGTESVG